MDGKGFFLGVLVAIALFLLWKRENAGGMNFSFAGLMPAPGAGAGDSGGCAGCSSGIGCSGCGSPAGAAAPAAQALSLSSAPGDGQISPGTPPLQTAVGSGSFYALAGPTPDSSFTNYPAKPVSTSIFKASGPSGGGSATTPANAVPPRAVQQVPSYSNQGFTSRYNVSGVPRGALRKTGYLQ
jgi:hypothetical protein